MKKTITRNGPPICNIFIVLWENYTTVGDIREEAGCLPFWRSCWGDSGTARRRSVTNPEEGSGSGIYSEDGKGVPSRQNGMKGVLKTPLKKNFLKILYFVFFKNGVSSFGGFKIPAGQNDGNPGHGAPREKHAAEVRKQKPTPGRRPGLYSQKKRERNNEV